MLLVSIFGFIAVIIVSAWLIVELMQLFPKSFGGFIMFVILALGVLYTARAILKSLFSSNRY